MCMDPFFWSSFLFPTQNKCVQIIHSKPGYSVIYLSHTFPHSLTHTLSHLLSPSLALSLTYSLTNITLRMSGRLVPAVYYYASIGPSSHMILCIIKDIKCRMTTLLYISGCFVEFTSLHSNRKRYANSNSNLNLNLSLNSNSNSNLNSNSMKGEWSVTGRTGRS